METQVRQMTPEEYKQGHAPCHCGEFTHVFRQCAMQRLPRDYSGELCPRCNLWMCRTDKLAPTASAGSVEPALGPLPECYVTSGGRDLWNEEQMLAYAAQVRAAERERCAVIAWTHYMDVCKVRGLPPSEHEHWNAARAVRAG